MTSADASARSRLIVRGGRVFDPESGELYELDVAVEGGRVAELGVGLDGGDVVDAAGLTVLPGLFDCHVHVTVRDTDVWRAVQVPLSYRLYEAVVHLKATLALGITTVRDAAGADLGVKAAVQDGLITGPRMQISVTMLSQTGGHGDYSLPSGVCAGLIPQLPGTPNPVVDGPDEMRRAVRAVLRCGADVIKVAATGGVLSPRDDPRHAHFRPRELEVLVEEASAAGVPVMAHALGAAGIKAAVRAGVRSIEHGVYLDDEAIDLMLEHGTFLVPTLSAGRSVLLAGEAGASLHEESMRKQRTAIRHHEDSFRRALDAGVRIAMGTDAGVTPHGKNLWELALMVDAGMTPVQALRSATRDAAELMGLSNELGAISPGKRADLVLVKGDPFDLEDLGERIARVYKDGRLVHQVDQGDAPAVMSSRADRGGAIAPPT
jgi:imidazolonepropionase-like amidohydrolase